MLLACALAWAIPLQAQELKLLAEHAVEGMAVGNLSGLARCGEHWWAVSDRDDQQLYQLTSRAQGDWQAHPVAFSAPPAPSNELPWGMRAGQALLAPWRGGSLDFEAISCDQAGNRYLLSEAHAAVLWLPVIGHPRWLDLPPSVVRQARGSGMLLQFNRLFEGLAVDPSGQHLWLAAEENRRGVLALQQKNGRWLCQGGCVVQVEGGLVAVPQAPEGPMQPRDYSDISYWQGKLFTLERAQYQICRRDLQQAQAERCWSFAEQGLHAERRYPTLSGVAEALVVDADGAWIGVDNGNMTRADGEQRPVIWHFAVPDGGWGV